ncbi:hypothetical protein [Coleofasciculus sp. H7-2]
MRCIDWYRHPTGCKKPSHRGRQKERSLQRLLTTQSNLLLEGAKIVG